MTPLQIEILIHYFAKVGDFPNHDAPGVNDEIQKFLEDGILKLDESGTEKPSKYVGNQEALKPYMQAISSVPLPKKVWVVEE